MSGQSQLLRSFPSLHSQLHRRSLPCYKLFEPQKIFANSRKSDATLGLTISVISHTPLSLCVCSTRRPMQTMQDTALYQPKADPAMQPNFCEAHRTVWDGRLTWPEVGTADLREAPAKLLQASADAILLVSAAVLSKTQRFGLDEFGSDERPARSGDFIRFASADWLTQIWHFWGKAK